MQNRFHKQNTIDHYLQVIQLGLESPFKTPWAELGNSDRARIKKTIDELESVRSHYSTLVLSKLCSDLSHLWRLPRELRDFIYSHMASFRDDINLYYTGTSYITLAPPCSDDVFDNPWYLKPCYVGCNMAREMLEIQYRKALFCLDHDRLIPLLLKEDRWCIGAVPELAIRRIQPVLNDQEAFPAGKGR